MHGAEIAIHLLLGIRALFYRDDGNGLAVQPGNAGQNGMVVAVKAIAVQLEEIRKQGRDVAGGGGAAFGACCT